MKKNIPNDDEYEDSYSILGSDDGQEALESLIEMLQGDDK